MNLTNLNPWWINREEIKKDGKILDLERKKYKYHPKLIDWNYKPGNIYSIRGPRQLGKTTAIKLIIKRLLDKKLDPYSIFFWSCEDILDFKGLVELIKEYLNIVQEKELQDKFIFLDEISFVKDWQRGVKLLVDRGYLKDCCLVITGSNVVDVKTSVERLPGRKGKESKDFDLLPLTFFEFCEILGFEGNIKSVKDLQIIDAELKKLFQKYLKTGGFPLVINELLAEGNNPTWLKEIYYSWIIGDVLKMGKSEKVALQIISSLISKQPSALSWDSLSKDAELKSHLTISSYLELLEEMFVLKIVYFYDFEKKRSNPNKNKKIHFLDSYIYGIFCESTKQTNRLDVIYEDLVCFHLCKQLSDVFYTKRKKELDFVVMSGKEAIGVEVKCQEKISKEDYLSFLPVKRGFLITKNKFEVIKKFGKVYYAVPIHWFAYLRFEKLIELFK